MIVQSLSALSLEEVLKQVDRTFEVEAAVLESRNAAKELNLFMNPEDYNIHISPTLKSTSLEDGEFGEQVEILGTSSLKIPLGFSSMEKEKISFAEDTLLISEMAVSSARENAFMELYSLFQNAWLLQEEEKVLETETKSAEAYAAVLRENFRAGTASITELSTAEEDLQTSIEDQAQNLLKQRLAWFELNLAARLDQAEKLQLQRGELEMELLPAPAGLPLETLTNRADIKTQALKIRQLENTINRLKSPDIDLSVKPFFNFGDHSASVSYDFSNPGLTAAYSFPIAAYGEIPSSGNSAATWNTGITFDLSIGSNKSDTLDVEALSVRLHLETARYEYLLDNLNLQLRSYYQQYLRAREALSQYQRYLDRSRENKEILEVKSEFGRISEHELLEAEAQVQRAAWKIEEARIELERSYLKAVSYTHLTLPTN